MDDSRRLSPLSLALALGLVAAGGTRAGANPYYNATDVSTLTPAQYAGLYPTSPSVALTDAQIKELPGINGLFGTDPRTPTFFPMHPIAANAAGTVIGVVPDGESFAIPYSSTEVGYAQMQPDGTYGPFVLLSSNHYAEATMNSQNQILLYGGVDQKIIDLNTGTTTEFASLVSPATLQQYGGWLYPLGIADNGAILAQYARFNQGDWTYGGIILTPPGVALPAVTPEPTTLVTLLVGLGGLALRRRSGRNG